MARNVFFKIDPAVVEINRSMGYITVETVPTLEWDEDTQCDVRSEREVFTVRGVEFHLRPFTGENGQEEYYWFACGSSAMEGYFKEYPFVLEERDY